MSEIATVGLDVAKNAFQVLTFFGHLQPCVVAMEACGGAHYRGHETRKLGHEVRRIPSDALLWAVPVSRGMSD